MKGRIINPNDRIVISKKTLENGDTIYFTGLQKGHIKVWSMNLKNKKINALIDKKTNSGLVYTKNKLFFLQDSLVSPKELYSYDLKTKSLPVGLPT